MVLEFIDGEIFRLYVDGYLIDLRANYGVGYCGCQDAEFRKQPLLEHHHKLPSEADNYRCKHLRWARRCVGLELLDRILLLEGKLREH